MIFQKMMIFQKTMILQKKLFNQKNYKYGFLELFLEQFIGIDCTVYFGENSFFLIIFTYN